MKRQYSRPVVEKISYDYRTQIVTESVTPDCFGSIINVVPEGSTVCESGVRTYIGWNEPNPGQIGS